MEAATVTRDTRKRRSHSAYDSALIKAKRDKTPVDLVLAADFATPDDGLLSADETITADVCHVDTYSILFKIGTKEVWISKTFIAGIWLR